MASGAPVSPPSPADTARAGRLTRGFAWTVVHLRYPIVAAWIAAAVAAHMYLPAISQIEGGPLNLLAPAGSTSLQVQKASVKAFGTPLLTQSEVVQRDPRGLSAQAQARVFQRVYVLDTRSHPDVSGLAAAIPITNTLRLLPGSRESSTTAVTYLFFSPQLNLGQRYQQAHTLEHRYFQRPGDHLVGVTGAGPARWEQGLILDHSLAQVEIATLLLITLVGAIAFRGVGAPLITLFAAGIAYEISIRVIAWGGQRQGFTIPVELQPLLVVLLLAIVTDYSIFFMSGARRLLRSGTGGVAAAGAASLEFTPIIFTAGLTVSASTAALLAANIQFLRALGPGMAVSVFIGLVAAITLVPALIAIFGRLVFWPSLGAGDVRPLTGEERARQARLSVRGRIVGLIARPLVAVPLALLLIAGLLAAGQLLRDVRFGVDLIKGMPGSAESERAAVAAGRGFAPGVVAPTLVLVQGPGLARRQPALARLQMLIADQPGVAGVIGPREQLPGVPRNIVVNSAGDAARYVVILDSDPYQATAIDHVRALRVRLLALSRQAGVTGVRLGVGGDTAIASETIDATVGGIWRIAVAMVLVDLALLALFLRSLIAPVYLLGASVLALGAPLGIGAYVFERLLGTGDLSYFVPIAAGVLLVALGSDYNIFVVGRISEEARRRPRREALRVAVPLATSSISVAGITLAASFALLAIVPTTPFREFAFVMAVGILIDSFLVRSYLVPALIAVLGNLNRWPRAAPAPAP
ncbi:MAG: MMPL family transporter [Candidatus Dormibacteraceae bacterium]